MISNKGYICCNPMLTQKILKNVNETVLNRQVGNQYPIDSKIIIALNKLRHISMQVGNNFKYFGSIGREYNFRRY